MKTLLPLNGRLVALCPWLPVAGVMMKTCSIRAEIRARLLKSGQVTTIAPAPFVAAAALPRTQTVMMHPSQAKAMMRQAHRSTLLLRARMGAVGQALGQEDAAAVVAAVAAVARVQMIE